MPVSLTPTSYVVLGLVQVLEPCTSYDMKRLVGISIGHFWSFPHSQLYAEPARLARHGLLEEEQEEHGRRRRLYRLTPAGASALRAWLQITDVGVGELRDLGLLKLFFSVAADPEDVATIARAKREAHIARRAALEEIRDGVAEQASPVQLATLELGLRIDAVSAEFWGEIAECPPQEAALDDRHA
jgi:PadR family transcriptional regulator, regulatory protein AphA